MINVTKTFLPPYDEYCTMLKRAWDKTWITNNGDLVLELEEKLKNYFGLRHLWFCSNGTIVLQMALKALEISGEVITTPFSYVATANAIIWENCNPVFVDIDNRNFCIDHKKIEAAINSRTGAILATHVYGYPCDVDAIDAIARKHKLKVIYDAAHAFGTSIHGKSIFQFGDISTCSFHATKLFHTGEGGCIVCENDELAQKLSLYRSFGHVGEEYFSIGINGKNSELHAAMGLCNLKYVGAILDRRKTQWEKYRELLRETELQMLELSSEVDFNHAYFPLVFRSENDLLNAMQELKKIDVLPRRYFYPSLNNLPFLEKQRCPVAESIAKRVICLPMFHDLKEKDQLNIAEAIYQSQKALI
jgi:dTDP-4-amino-4,6-dideoxygalactose transaminase